MWMKRSSATLAQGVKQRNFLRENKLLVQQMPPTALCRFEMDAEVEKVRERGWRPVVPPSYELPTAASLARRAVTPPLVETQRRLLEGGHHTRIQNTRSEKQIQTEDISDEQFLNTALLKLCTVQGETRGRARQGEQAQTSFLARTCSEGDEPLITAGHSASEFSSSCLRRTASNFELGKVSAAHSSYQSLPYTRPDAEATANTVPADLDQAKTQEQMEDIVMLSICSDSVATPHVLQLTIPDITDVEQYPQLDQSLSARTNASSHSQISKRCEQPLINSISDAGTTRAHRSKQKVDEDQVLLTEPQRIAMLRSAQMRYNQLICEYNRLPLSMGTLRVRNLKVQLEKQLDSIDNDLSVLNLPNVYIRRDQLQQISSISCL